MTEKYRHEYKYLLSETSLKMFSSRLKGLMKKDPHAGEEGKYLIRSIYFDDIYKTAFFDNEDGSENKEKFRIRAYNGDTSFISLELKKKEHGKTLKLSEVIDEEKYSELTGYGSLSGKAFTDAGPLYRKLMLEKKTRLMKPAIIVQYEREPFIYKDGNVRVTFDRNISASERCDLFFEKNIAAMPVLPKDVHLLEVKWDEFLPEPVRAALDNKNLQITAFSKYYLGMKNIQMKGY